MSGSNRLLAVSWALPPVLAPRAIQVARALHGLREQGWDIAAIAADPATVPRSWRVDPGLAKTYPDPGVVRRLSARLAWPGLGRLAPPLRQRPDPFSAWARRAVVAGSRLAEQCRPAGVISFAQPWSSHMAGMALARRTRLPWIAHFSDPWVDTVWHARRSRLARRFNEAAESRVIERADAVVFVTDEARDLVMRKYPAVWRAKTSVLPHCWDPALRLPGALPRPGAPCRIVSTGSLDDTRDIAPLCAALRALLASRQVAPTDLTVRLIGASVPEAMRVPRRLGVGARVQTEPAVSLSESMEAMRTADALLIIDAPGAGQQSPFLASKTVEYLTARRPIVALTPLRSPSASLVRRLGGVVAPPENPTAIAAAMTEIVRRHRSGRLSVSETFDRVAEGYSMQQLAVQWDALVSAVTAGPRVDATQELAAA
jgi:hypothetical protein